MIGPAARKKPTAKQARPTPLRRRKCAPLDDDVVANDRGQDERQHLTAEVEVEAGRRDHARAAEKETVAGSEAEHQQGGGGSVTGKRGDGRQGDSAEVDVPGEADREAGGDDGGSPAVQVPGEQVDRADAERAGDDGRQPQRERIAAEQCHERCDEVPEPGRLLEHAGAEHRPIRLIGEHHERLEAALGLVEPDAPWGSTHLPEASDQRKRQQERQGHGIDPGPARQERACIHAGSPPEPHEEQHAGDE